MAHEYGLPRGPLASYLGVRDANRRAGIEDTQNAAGLMQILAQGQRAQLQQQQMLQEQQKAQLAQEREQAMRSALTNLPPDATPEAVTRAIIPHAGADTILRTMQGSQDRAAQRETTTANAAAAREQRLHEIEQRAEQEIRAIRARAEEGRISKQEADNRERMTREMMIRLTASLRPAPQPREEPAPVAVIGPDGKPVFVRRSEAYGRTPIQETSAQKAEAKRKFIAPDAGVGQIIEEAENLLAGKKTVGGVTTASELPTQSMLGDFADIAGSVVGYSPTGAAQADRLKAIGGQLVSKMPRMEGPQSNFDVKLYQDMAGQVGNPRIPIARRTAALETIKELFDKYGTQAPMVDRRAPPAGPPPGAVRRID